MTIASGSVYVIVTYSLGYDVVYVRLSQQWATFC